MLYTSIYMRYFSHSTNYTHSFTCFTCAHIWFFLFISHAFLVFIYLRHYSTYMHSQSDMSVMIWSSMSSLDTHELFWCVWEPHESSEMRIGTTLRSKTLFSRLHDIVCAHVSVRNTRSSYTRLILHSVTIISSRTWTACALMTLMILRSGKTGFIFIFIFWY